MLVEPPTPTPMTPSSRSRSEQTLHNEDDDEDGDGQEGKDRQVKEGAYLKSKLWWFGLLLIATGEGGESRLLCHRVIYAVRMRYGIWLTR